MTFGQYSATGDLIPQTRVPYLTSLRSLAHSDYTDYTRTRSFHHDRVYEQIDATLNEANDVKHSLSRVNQARGFVHTAQETSQILNRVTPFISGDVSSDLFTQQIEISLAAFASGLGVSANLNLPQFDSHNQNDIEQMRLIPKLLAGVDYLLTRAETLGLRDQLVVMIQSEMGRTPWYNQAAGKDHWSVTSMMVLGQGITGGRVIGGTTLSAESGFEQTPIRINPSTLASSESGVRIRPEHIQYAARELFGITEHPLSQRFPLNLPSEERFSSLWSGL